MAISTVSITQGSGTNITVDSSSGGDMQVIKLAESVLGSTSLVPASASTGLLVNLGTVSAAAVPVTNVPAQNLNVAVVGAVSVTGSSVSVSNTPSVAQSGTWNIGTVASITATVTVAGTVSVGNTPAVSQSGTWNIGTVASITGTVTVTGSVSVTGTATVAGTVTDNQGTPASTANAWPIKVADGTNVLAMQNVSGTYALPVTVLAQVGGGFSQADGGTFTASTTPSELVGGVFNDSLVALGSGKTGAARMSAYRGLHVNLRSSAGAEISSTSIGMNTALLVSVGNTPTVNVSEIAGFPPFMVGELLQVQQSPSGFGAAGEQTPWKSGVSISATGNTLIHTPVSGKTYFLEGLVVSLAAGSTLTVTVYDNTNSAANILFQGNAVGTFVVTPSRPVPSSGINNLLNVNVAGTGTVAVLVTAWGYDQ